MIKREPTVVMIFKHAGSFAENKDVARTIRVNYLLPALQNGKDIVLDYGMVNSTTQSFTHALISDAIRLLGVEFFDRVSFKNCNESVRKIIGIVAEYMQRKIVEDNSER